MGQNAAFSERPDSMPEDVVQRRDGTDAEKVAVNNLLQKMDEYLVHEVYPKVDYEPGLSRW